MFTEKKEEAENFKIQQPLVQDSQSFLSYFRAFWSRKTFLLTLRLINSLDLQLVISLEKYVSLNRRILKEKNNLKQTVSISSFSLKFNILIIWHNIIHPGSSLQKFLACPLLAVNIQNYLFPNQKYFKSSGKSSFAGRVNILF